MSPTHRMFCKMSCITMQRLASGCIAFIVSLSACADDAATVRTGPSLAALHSHLQFNFLVSPRRADESDPFLQQAHRVIAGLQVAGAGMFPEAVQRIGAFDVFVADSDELSAASSATGQIALNAAFIALKPTDDWLAYVLAREMAHVIAGHHANNSTASIATSVVMNLLLPGSGLLRSALSFVGSQLASFSGRERQAAEADEIAIRLLEAAGYAQKSLALSLALGPGDQHLSGTLWGRAFSVSARTLVAKVRGPGALAAPSRATEPETPLISVASVSNAHIQMTTGSLPRIAPEQLLIRSRPSGMPGVLLLDGQMVPVRRIE